MLKKGALTRVVIFAVVVLPSLVMGRTVVLYSSVDSEYLTPIVNSFQKESGIKVRVVTDSEATKSVGLAERLRAEKEHPRCDVWWGNEPFYTVGLAEEGLFEKYQSASAKDVPDRFKDKEHRWTGNGLRARVIARVPGVDATKHVAELDDLLRPEFRGKIAMGRPGVGTIGGQVAAIYALRGEEKADAFFRGLYENKIILVGGNSPVPQQIAAGNFVLGLTDNDDVAATQRNDGKVEAVLPDQGESESGTLAIMTTVALVKRADIEEDSRKLVDYLVSAKVEQSLIDVHYMGWSLRYKKPPFKMMEIDYTAVGKAMPVAIRRAAELLDGREPSKRN